MSQRHTWYRLAIARPDGPTEIVVAPGAHLGDAIALGVRHAGRGSWAAAAANAIAAEVPLGGSVGKNDLVVRGPDPDFSLGLRWPLGVVPSFDSARKAAAIRPGFARRTGDHLVLEAQLGGRELDELLLSVLERLPAADNIEIKVADHHDDHGTTEIWLSPRLGVKKAIHWLDDHDVEWLHNGHLELAIYLRKQRSTLRLTEHKTLAWVSDDADLTAQVATWLGEAVPELDTLSTLAQVGHFHWRPAATSARPRLIDRLRRQGLRKVDAWPGPRPPVKALTSGSAP
ncbi:MAG: hypothetical protein K8W52_00725 [Deltaproteobacteria bacterium]|nr:hypothetical protein [Deltaproteobacteria bacterium]